MVSFVCFPDLATDKGVGFLQSTELHEKGLLKGSCEIVHLLGVLKLDFWWLTSLFPSILLVNIYTNILD